MPLAAPIGLSPPLILTLCGPERVLVVSTEPPDDLSCLTTPGVGRPGDGAVARLGGWVGVVGVPGPAESRRWHYHRPKGGKCLVADPLRLSPQMPGLSHRALTCGRPAGPPPNPHPKSGPGPPPLREAGAPGGLGVVGV